MNARTRVALLVLAGFFAILVYSLRGVSVDVSGDEVARVVRLFELDDEQQMNRELLELMPNGSSTLRAKKLMERAGYTCRWCRNDSFRDRENVDFLYCNLEKDMTDRHLPFSIPISKRWQIGIIHQGGAIIEVDSGTSLTGL